MNTQGPDLLPRVRKSSQAESPVSCPASSGATELTNQKDLRHKCKQQAMHSVADLTTARHECKPPSSALSQTYSYSQQLPTGRRWQEKGCAVYPGQAVAQISKAQGPDLLPRVRKSSKTESPVSCPASSGAKELTNRKNLRHECKQPTLHSAAALTTARHECRPPSPALSPRPTATSATPPKVS